MLHVPSKLFVFAWRLLRYRLPTKANLARRRVLQHDDIMCVGGCDLSETEDHLFVVCDIYGTIWNLLWQWLGISHVAADEIREHFIQFTDMAGMPRSSYPFFKVIWLGCVWVIWKERNDRIFNNVASDPVTLIDKGKLNSFLWLKFNNATFLFNYHEWWCHPLLCMGVYV